MSTNKPIEGELTGAIANYALVVSRFNSYIVDSLEAGAVDALQRHGEQTPISRFSVFLARWKFHWQ